MDMSELERLEQQQRITKLSEAMRIGERMRPTQHGANEFIDRNGACCALGHAAVGSGWKSKEESGPVYLWLEARFPSVGERLERGIYLNNWNRLGMSTTVIADKLAAMGC